MEVILKRIIKIWLFQKVGKNKNLVGNKVAIELWSWKLKILNLCVQIQWNAEYRTTKIQTQLSSDISAKFGILDQTEHGSLRPKLERTNLGILPLWVNKSFLPNGLD